MVPLEADESRLERLRLVGAHFVLVDRGWPEDHGCSVAVDDIRGGMMAMEHLKATTGGSVALINGPRHIPQCADREDGARAALEAAGLDPQRLIVETVEQMTIEAGAAAASRLAASSPQGVFCTNDQLAVGAIRGFGMAGLTVPADVAVVGYGDLALATESLTPLTSVRQPKDALGRLATELLLGEIENNSAPHHHQAHRLEPSLVIRDSAPRWPSRPSDEASFRRPPRHD